ncbi:MAG TPA: hypothetical protein VFU86_16760 [Terriglobales bacterium]|nr:hypothetical protein [Terriglobales bacterium]
MPERNPQDERARKAPEPQIGGLDRASYGISWTWWWVVLFVVIIVAFWFAGWGFGGYGGWWWGKKTVAIVQPDIQLSGSGVAIIDAPDKSVYAGQPFQLNNVPIQKKVNDKAMWIGNLTSGPMLIVFGGNNGLANAPAGENKSSSKSRKNHSNQGNQEGTNANNQMANNSAANSAASVNRTDIAQGDRVNVTGTVEKAPPSDTAKSQWGLSDAGVQRLEQQHAFIEVSQITKLQSADH